MRPTRRVVAVLAGILLMLPGVALPPPAASQIPSGFSTAQQPVRDYFDHLLAPAVQGKALAQESLASFYRDHVSDHTRVKIDEEEFTAYWMRLSARPRSIFSVARLDYSIGDPLESEAGDQALVLTSGRIFVAPALGVPSHVVLGCPSGLEARLPASLGCLQDSPLSVGTDGAFDAVYRVVKEGGRWKLVLPEGLIADMRATAPVITTRRFAPGTVVVDHGLTVRVLEVILRKDATSLRLSIENANDTDAYLFNALSLGSLTDEEGHPHDTRVLRSAIPERVGPGESVIADLVLEAVPLGSERLHLLLPAVRLGDREFPISVDVTLRTFPFAGLTHTPIPGEPVLYYVLGMLRSRFRTGEIAKTLYDRYLSDQIRAVVSEREFVRYHTGMTLDAWVCRLGDPEGFAVRGPTDVDPTTATFPVAVAGAQGLGILAFRVVKEADNWKLVLPEEILTDLKRPREITRRLVKVDASTLPFLDIGAVINEVELTEFETTVSLIVWNSRADAVSLKDVASNSYLMEEWGGATYRGRQRPGWELPSTIPPRSAVSVALSFSPLPLRSRRFVLVIGDFAIPPNTLNVEITLGCPR